MREDEPAFFTSKQIPNLTDKVTKLASIVSSHEINLKNTLDLHGTLFNKYKSKILNYLENEAIESDYTPIDVLINEISGYLDRLNETFSNAKLINNEKRIQMYKIIYTLSYYEMFANQSKKAFI